MTAADPAPLYTALKQADPALWRAYAGHEFVARLGDGSLPEAAFLTYLRQDYLFLIHFARAWALAVVKSDRIEEMRAAAVTMHALIDEEMRLHIETCAGYGISEAELGATAEAPETLAYTRFVIDAGVRGDLLDLLVALMPCVLGYGEIGLALAPTLDGAPNHPYRAWIETYAGPEYQAACQGAAALLTKVANRTIGADPRASPRWPDLRKLFATATALERDFWSMGLRA